MTNYRMSRINAIFRAVRRPFARCNDLSRKASDQEGGSNEVPDAVRFAQRFCKLLIFQTPSIDNSNNKRCSNEWLGRYKL